MGPVGAPIVGPEPSPLVQSDEANPFGAAFAVISAASQLQLAPQATYFEPMVVDTYLWNAGLPPGGNPRNLVWLRDWGTVVRWGRVCR